MIFFREYIKRHLEFGHRDNKHEDSAIIFKYKKIKQSMIEVFSYICFCFRCTTRIYLCICLCFIIKLSNFFKHIYWSVIGFVNYLINMFYILPVYSFSYWLFLWCTTSTFFYSNCKPLSEVTVIKFFFPIERRLCDEKEWSCPYLWTYKQIIHHNSQGQNFRYWIIWWVTKIPSKFFFCMYSFEPMQWYDHF